MAKTLGYMVTWTTYGTWLQGDKRGYVREGKIPGWNPRLEQRNKENQTGNIIKLTNKQQKLIRKAILEEACKLEQKVYCFDEESLRARIDYVKGHIKQGI
jgi:hypothetical protein